MGSMDATSSLTFDTEAAENRPVSKVITLLKDMLKQLEKEAEEDEEIYDKVACWCETNDKEKTKAIADAEAKIADLTTKIEELTAASARLNTEIKNLEKEVAANQEALDQATAIREKQLAEFNAEEKDLLESISALKAAVTAPGGGFSPSSPKPHHCCRDDTATADAAACPTVEGHHQPFAEKSHFSILSSSNTGRPNPTKL